MRYLRLGSLDSATEEDAVIRAFEAGQVDRRVFAAYALVLDELNAKGFEAVRDKWITTREPRVVLYTGRSMSEEPTTAGGRRIWAAIELNDNGRVHCLLKIAADYSGDERQYADNLTDALDRFKKGNRYP